MIGVSAAGADTATGTALRPTWSDTGNRWVSGSAEARASVKWIVATVGAIATAVFGAGPLLTVPDVDVLDWEPWRIVLAVSGAMFALLGMAYTLQTLLESLTPSPLSLSSLPATFVKVVADSPDDFLLPGMLSVEHLRSRLQAYRTASHAYSLQALECDTQDRAEELRALAKRARDNYNVATQIRERLLDHGEYITTQVKVRRAIRGIQVGGCIAVLGVVAYMFALPHKEASASFQTGVLRTAEGNSNAMWSGLGLQACVIGYPGSVPVAITTSNYTGGRAPRVRTIGVPDGCPTIEFEVPGGVVLTHFTTTSTQAIE